MSYEKKSRLIFSVSSVLVVLFSAVFVMIVSKINSSDMLFLLGTVATFYIVLMCVYFWKVEIFEDDGNFRAEVYIVLVAVPVILQLMFGFLHFAYQEIQLRHIGYLEGSRFYTQAINEIVVEILTSVALSILFTIELVLFSMQLIISKKRESSHILHYIRQIAFIFFFASSLSSSFIPVIAKNFVGNSEHYLISLPQTATFLCTCITIVVFPKIASLRGIKLPFIAGACVYIAGVITSILANSIAVFIIARGIVGLGYGLCWMTLRGLSSLADTEAERNKSFSALNSGVYAGIICGSVFGSILMQNFQSTTLVFFVSIAISIVALLFFTQLKDSCFSSREHTIADIHLCRGDYVFLCVFVLLMIFPSCLVESFLGYYFPLWINENGLKFTDYGRAQLLYGVCIVHIGPFIMRFIKLKGKSANILYSTILGASLLVFFFVPDTITGLAICAVIGLADSFGFVAQNSLFLTSKVSQKLGKAQAMSLLSFCKKISAAFGPLIFGLAFSVGNGLLFLGMVIIGLAFLFIFTKERERV